MAQKFSGTIRTDARDSTPDWPKLARAPEGAPNVLYIVLDDVGYGQLSPFGGLCHTPNLDKLAANGLRYRNFHTTALCSPTRACLLTGRNHHSNAMAAIVEASTGYPGYHSFMPFENGMLSEILTAQGWAAYAVGKWHLTPHTEMNMGAARTRWPLGRGFERFYGFLGGDTNQWEPDLVYDSHPVHPPKTPAQGYHLSEDLAERAIEFLTDLRNVSPEKPFFLYYCFGACHAPHHVAQEWSDKYRGAFDQGWDRAREEIFARQKALGLIPADTELTERPAWIQPWDSLSAEEKKLYARMMEVYAGFAEHTDAQIGRVLDFLAKTGDLDNTIVVAISDNGASAEGGPHGSLNEALFFNRVPEDLAENLRQIDELGSPSVFNHYPFGWAWAGNTPFQRWKREVHEGGIADLCIVHWPHGIRARNEIRGQYVHAIDVTPTILDCLGVEPPAEIRGVAQSPLQGRSFRPSFDDAAAPAPRDTQYYEMLGNRAIYHRGWKAVTYHGTAGMIYDGVTDPTKPFNQDRWELYHVAEDFSESHDLAQEQPEKLRELVELWFAEAGRHDVLPLDAKIPAAIHRPRVSRPRRRFVYYPGGSAIETLAAANVKNRSHKLVAEVEIPTGGAQGVIAAEGTRFGGWVLYVKDRRLCYAYNFLAVETWSLVGTELVPSGKCTLAYEFEKTGPERFGAGGIGRLFVNGVKAGELAIPRTVRFMFGLGGGLQIGRQENASPIVPEFAAPFAFTGTIRQVAIELEGAEQRDPKAEQRIALGRQ
jgi:arylsulfatase